MPPSTVTISPVMKSLRISSSAGAGHVVHRALAPQRNAVGEVVRLGGLGHRLVEAGADDAGRQHVDADAFDGMVEGERLGERDQARPSPSDRRQCRAAPAAPRPRRRAPPRRLLSPDKDALRGKGGRPGGHERRRHRVQASGDRSTILPGAGPPAAWTKMSSRRNASPRARRGRWLLPGPKRRRDRPQPCRRHIGQAARCLFRGGTAVDHDLAAGLEQMLRYAEADPSRTPVMTASLSAI